MCVQGVRLEAGDDRDSFNPENSHGPLVLPRPTPVDFLLIHANA